MVIFRTLPEHMQSVVARSMHALQKLPRRLAIGDHILISQSVVHGSKDDPRIRYVMECVEKRADRTGEALQIWGKNWAYIIVDKNCRALSHPFSIQDIQVSNHDYGRGGPFVYVDPADERIILQRGLLG